MPDTGNVKDYLEFATQNFFNSHIKNRDLANLFD